MKKAALSVLMLGMLAACASNKPAPVTAPVAMTPGSAQTAPASQEVVNGQELVVNGVKIPGDLVAHRSVYYDFDSSAVKDEYKPLVTAHAHFLVAHPQLHARLEGNTDERGSDEYNLALGQRRAESVRKMMSFLGVPSSQMEAVSYGEEKPTAMGHNEEAWKQNRRTDIHYVAR